jgi:hypothetical protein
MDRHSMTRRAALLLLIAVSSLTLAGTCRGEVDVEDQEGSLAPRATAVLAG